MKRVRVGAEGTNIKNIYRPLHIFCTASTFVSHSCTAGTDEHSLLESLFVQ
jgi:hypothetical protein